MHPHAMQEAYKLWHCVHTINSGECLGVSYAICLAGVAVAGHCFGRRIYATLMPLLAQY